MFTRKSRNEILFQAIFIGLTAEQFDIEDKYLPTTPGKGQGRNFFITFPNGCWVKGAFYYQERTS